MCVACVEELTVTWLVLALGSPGVQSSSVGSVHVQDPGGLASAGFWVVRIVVIRCMPDVTH